MNEVWSSQRGDSIYGSLLSDRWEGAFDCMCWQRVRFLCLNYLIATANYPCRKNQSSAANEKKIPYNFWLSLNTWKLSLWFCFLDLNMYFFQDLQVYTCGIRLVDTQQLQKNYYQFITCISYLFLFWMIHRSNQWIKLLVPFVTVRGKSSWNMIVHHARHACSEQWKI